MAPLIVLVVMTLTARTLGLFGIDYVGSWPSATAVGLAAMFTVTGLSHFTPTRREGLVAIVPPRLPHPDLLVTTTGVMELLGAVALLIPTESGPYRTITAWALTLFLLAVFPANVYAARERRSPTSPNTPLTIRAALQAIFLCATLFVALSS